MIQWINGHFSSSMSHWERLELESELTRCGRAADQNESMGAANIRLDPSTARRRAGSGKRSEREEKNETRQRSRFFVLDDTIRLHVLARLP